jgi:hypothetical protein
MDDFTDITRDLMTKPLIPKKKGSVSNMLSSMSRMPTLTKYLIPNNKNPVNRMSMSRMPTLNEPLIPKEENRVSNRRLSMLRMPTMRMPTLPTLPTMRMPTLPPILTVSKMDMFKKIIDIDKNIEMIRKSEGISEDKTEFIKILEDYKEILKYRRKYDKSLNSNDKTRKKYIYELENIEDEISTKYAILDNLDLQIVEYEKLLTNMKKASKDLKAKLEVLKDLKAKLKVLKDLKAKLEVLKELEIAYQYMGYFERIKRIYTSQKDTYFINLVLYRAGVCITKLKEGEDLKDYIPIFKYGEYDKLIAYLGRECAMPLAFLNIEELLVLFPQLVEMSKSTSSLSDLITLLVELNTILEILKKEKEKSISSSLLETFKQQFKTLIDTNFIPLYNTKQHTHIEYCLNHFLTVEDFKRVIYTVDNLKKMELNVSLLKDILKYEIFTVSDLIKLLDEDVLNVKVSDLKLVFEDYDVLTVKEILALLKKEESAYYSDIDKVFKKLFENILTIEDFTMLSNREILTVEDLLKLDNKYDDSISDEEILEGLKQKLTAAELLKVKRFTKYVLTTLLKYKILPIEVLKEFYILGFGNIRYPSNRITEEEFESFLIHKVLTVKDLQDFYILVKELKKLLTLSTLNDTKFEYFYQLLKHTDKNMLKKFLTDLEHTDELTKLLNSNLEMLENRLKNEGKKSSSSGGRKAKANAKANAKAKDKAKAKAVKPSPVKKVVCGKLRCIYKIHGSRKEHLKYKGQLITVAEYKKMMKH